VIPDTLDHVTQGELQRYENNYKVLNPITTILGRNAYDRVAYLKMTHDVWLKLCNTYEGSSEIKSLHRDTYNRQYQTFSQKPKESLDDCFACFATIVSSLHFYGPLALPCILVYFVFLLYFCHTHQSHFASHVILACISLIMLITMLG
jgi:hypothetical protein